ncbi:hypothetical protein IV203_005211 [Nitzschia inconspicua]|uniref:JmjC domain-containing protein n=1 Tax=Nitzschia inconspicua TaxID=303405 RepID=A0A9K3KNH3_9STRA|nr:hypothetical protein IV203_005211 [Nitzschia inconspicua]
MSTFQDSAVILSQRTVAVSDLQPGGQQQQQQQQQHRRGLQETVEMDRYEDPMKTVPSEESTPSPSYECVNTVSGQTSDGIFDEDSTARNEQFNDSTSNIAVMTTVDRTQNENPVRMDVEDLNSISRTITNNDVVSNPTVASNATVVEKKIENDIFLSHSSNSSPPSDRRMQTSDRLDSTALESFGETSPSNDDTNATGTLHERKPTPATMTTVSSPLRAKKGGKKKNKIKGTKSKAAKSTGPVESFEQCEPVDVILQLSLPKGHIGNKTYWDKAVEFLPLWGDVINDKKGQNDLTQRLVDYIEKDVGGRFLEGGGIGFVVVEREKMFGKVKRMMKEMYERKVIKVAKKPKPNESTVISETDEPRSARRKKTTGISDRGIEADNEPPRKKKKIKARNHDSAEVVEVDQPTITYQRPPVEPQKQFVYEEDPNQFYQEETAYKYHDPPLPGNLKYSNWISPLDLRRIPPPPPLPAFPNTGSCSWSYDEVNRVLMADFSLCGQKPINFQDSRFLFEMQERDDITVISRGLLDISSLDPQFWDLNYLRDTRGEDFFHKLRRFDRQIDSNGIESFMELDHLYSMKIKDFVRYCGLRESFLQKKLLDPDEEEPQFTFVDHKDVQHNVGVWSSAFYMIDMDMARVLPDLYENFKASFKLPAVLPGGDNCMMNKVTASARPFMGPNLYITPPASFTHFHQDGHGTVDSGHLCIEGYNEVVILRRLTERHKKHALWILSGSKTDSSYWDGLYKEPHGDGLGKKPKWATNEMIAECKRMGYCPSVLILKPGDLIHINKGRLHAFRKLSSAELPESDCHAEQRKTIVKEAGLEGREVMCISVAWDWMNRGVTPAGINREMCTVLEGTILNKKNMVTSLAIPELSLLQMATFLIGQTRRNCGSFLSTLGKNGHQHLLYKPQAQTICQGILPGLQYLVNDHSNALADGPNDSSAKGERLSIAKVPDTQENPALCPLDPFGNTDFDCKLCRRELSNVYFHCDGCEKLLNKDFNICQECYKQKEYMQNIQMHPSNPKKKATLNHTGKMLQNRISHCPCKNGPKCDFCGWCLGCSCRCHSWFTVHTRLFSLEEELRLLNLVQKYALEPQDGAISLLQSQMEDRVNMALDRLNHAKQS